MNKPWIPHAAREARSASGRLIAWLTGVVMVAALVFGGASRENLLQVSALELLALPLLAAAVWRLTVEGQWRPIAVPTALLAAAAAIPLFQLIPLPYALWADIPGHEAPAEALRLAGLATGWRPLSLAPIETWRHFLALIPPAAVFLGTCALRVNDRRRLALIIPVAALASLLVGLMQVMGGPDSPLNFYETANLGSAIGLFSNRNHQAALMVVSLPFAALWIALAQEGRTDRRRLLIVLAVVLSLFLIEIVGLVVARSRAGLLLLAPSLAGSIALVLRTGGARTERRGGLVLAAGAALAVAAAMVFGAGPVLERFEDLDDGRLTTAPVVAKAAWEHLPFGAGVGSFPQVYAGVEPVETMGPSFWNHAHDDYLEIWLDAGWPGAVVLLAFLVWWVTRAVSVWRGDLAVREQLGRAASVAGALLLVHSTVDYPLRTLALACVFAFACALMTPRPRTAA